MISTPTAIRSFSRCTAASILRSSFSIPSTMSAAGELVDGERRRVDRFGGKRLPLRTHRHAIRTSGTSREYYHSRADGRIARDRMIDAYLDHLRVERRLADAHARELRARPRARSRRSRPAPARAGRRARSRTRSKRSSANSAAAGLSPRSVARGGRRDPRLLPLPRARPPARAAAPPTTCSRRAPGRRCRNFCRSRKSTR